MNASLLQELLQMSLKHGHKPFTDDILNCAECKQRFDELEWIIKLEFKEIKR